MTGIIESGTIRSALLVLGAGGEVGRGVVQAAVEAGRAVVAVGRDPVALAALQQAHPDARLLTLAATVDSDAAAAALADTLKASGIAFEGVVASIAGEHPCGRLIDQPADVLRRTLDEDLMPHLFAARHLFPLLPHDGRHGYVLIGGPGAHYPWAGYGHCSIAAAALRMMARVLHDEAERHGLRVQLLSLEAPIIAGHTDTASPKAVAAGRRALSLLGTGRAPVGPAVVELDRPQPQSRSRTQASRRGTALVPMRDLQAARDLLASLPLLPPTASGRLHDEAL